MNFIKSKWCECPEFEQFPSLCRFWLWWCSQGPKRSGVGTVGRNKLFSVVKKYFSLFPQKTNNMVSIWIERWGLYIVLDLLDFQIYQHTIPSISNTNSEFLLQEILLKPGNTFLDVGANYGMFTLFATQLVGSEGRVIAIEPQPRLAEALRQSKSQNDLKQVTILEMALSNQSGQEEFAVPSHSSGIGSLFQEHASSSSKITKINVNVKTLDQVVEEMQFLKIDLIKVDVEGAELLVFQGGNSLLREQSPFIWFEVNPGAQNIASITVDEILDFLKKLGYCKFYEVSNLVQGNYMEPTEFPKLTNLLAVHQKRLHEFERLTRDLEHSF
jgi:FkbM family methyltransferase